MLRKLSALAMIAALGLAVPTPAEADTRAQKAQAARAKKAEAAREKAALKQNLAQVKARQKIGKQALKRAMADLKVLTRQEVDARNRRLSLKPAVDRAYQFYRANKTPANKQAWQNAVDRYMPARNAAETLLARLNRARNDVTRIRDFQKAALQEVSTARAAAKIKPVPRARPQVDPRFVVNLNPTDVSVAAPGAALLGGPAVPPRTQAYGQVPQQGGQVANYGPPSFLPRAGATGAQLYLSTGLGQQFRVRQNANQYEQPTDPLN